ncbi:MAG TPA: SAM-dependent methyltransferase [Thermoplasmata archaeon]|nr:SAM-dependent methyltransferase [Thermoplasmata archaeon]
MTELDAVLARMRERADPGGGVRFDAFMDTALYAPDVGYYRRSGRTLGRAGDFYTASHVSPLFGWCLAERLLAAHRRAGAPDGFTVVELGAGDGTLAFDLIARLRRRLPDVSRWRYIAVEPSAPLRALAAEALRGSSDPRLTIELVADLPSTPPVAGCLLANELLDALPARRFRRTVEGWRELAVRWDAGRPTEILEPSAPMVTPSVALPDAVVGATLDLSPIAEGTIRGFADVLHRGEVILLDYGRDETDWTRRPGSGTLRAYRSHTVQLDPYSEPGNADLSVFVNFDRLRRAASLAGFRELSFQPQARALGAWGFAELQNEWMAQAPDTPERVRRQLAAKSLLFGFENFWALELATSELPQDD